MRKIVLFFFAVLVTLQLWAQRRVTGKVTDDKGIPIANASVLVKGTNTGTVTASDGTYALTIPANARTLVISSVDMGTEEITIGTESTFNTTLRGTDRSLQEVVVVGYGTQRRSEATGSVATVKGAAVAERPVQSFDQALAGRAAGVQVTIPAGVLNAPPVFRIRGTNSISLSSQPLIIVDGVPVITGDQTLTSAAGNALANINPADIESIDIAKDAASTAIYGSRAANGVVFITTRKGRAGKARVNYDGWVGWTSPIRLPDLLDAQQYTDYKNEAVVNANAIRSGSVNFSLNGVSTLPKFATYTDANGNLVNTNWYDYIYRTGLSQSNSLSVSGGNDNTTYYFSGGYTTQQGIIKKNDYKRKNILLNVDSRVNKILSVGGKVSYSNEENLAAASSGSLSTEAYGTTGLGRTALVNAPNISPYNKDGSYNIGATYIGPGANIVSGNQVGFYNPVVVLDNNRENNELDHIQSNVYLQLKPLSWITLRSQYGIDYISSDNDEFYTPIHGPGQGANGEATAAYRRRKNWVWTNTAQFDHTFFNDHSLSLLVGNEQQRRTVRGYGIDRTTLLDPAYTQVQAGFSTNNSYAMSFGANYLLSSFGRLNYNYKKKYLLSGNLRQDEYSALGVKKGVFWGASAGWEITQENFWQSAGLDKVFSSFKLRGSYGKVGNVNGIGDYDIYSTYASGLYGGTATLAFSNAGNDQLTWETSKKTDIGFSFGVLKDRLTGEITYFNNDIDGLILNVPQAPSTGLPNNIATNVGSMYNKGIEITLGGTPVNTRDFRWSSNFNITYVKNSVTSLAPGLTEVLYLTGSGTTGENVNRTATGYSVGYLWVVRTGGVDPANGRRIFYNKAGRAVEYQHIVPTGASQWTYKDDGTTAPAISQSADAVMYKPTVPKFTGGWDHTFDYKGFELNLLFTFQTGAYISYGTNAGLHDQRFWNNTVDVLQRWTKAGDVTNYPRAIYTDNVSYGNTIPLDINMFSSDFIKLKTATLSYTLPRNISDKARMSNARVYVSGQNLAMRTKYPGSDPEVSSNGTNSAGQGSERNSVVNGRTVTVGLQLGF